MKKKQVNTINDWECTDPDTLQYCFKIPSKKGAFIYRQWHWFCKIPEKITGEIWNDPEYWMEMTIDFYKLTYMEVIDSINGYYSSVEQIKELYGDNWQQIVCECYFEINIHM